MAVFAACPASPNCVSSDARDPRHAILPFVPQSSEPESWAALRSAILTLPRTRILVDEKDYLRVACRSAVLGFTDDLEIQLRPDEGEIAVRSASRCGSYDFGVNRRRVEKLRDLLHRRGLIR